ncbi:unnamed protein product [Rotaria sp. Silwood1]|nr:unnamed protein product [Rotaria sp. Silwood1]CAF1644275.1 unnamed protein product [Rotaria sp. Silwood1]CAF3816677.1 unnamed protein product [Rotaria sp. Silwood1]CAF4979858.1 unnamed protein product [Rotaria sp. Silwood1]
MNKINYLLKRGSIHDRRRSGRPRTTTTTASENIVVKEIQVKNNASVRNVSAKLKQQGWKTSRSSVHRVAISSGLKSFKKKKTQKLTYDNKIQRVQCAKVLRKKFGVSKRSKKWRWHEVINTDFSGKFTLESLSNPHNAGGWARNAAEIPLTIRNRPRNKFAIGVVFWGGISYDGLIPKNGPIDVTSWLKAQVKENRQQKTYMNGRLYAKFIKEVGYKHIRKLSSTEPLFPDDPDTKHRTKHVLETIDKLFIDRILPEEGDAKFADVWPIKKVWGIIKEKVRGEQFSSFEQLKARVNKNGRKLPVSTVKK